MIFDIVLTSCIYPNTYFINKELTVNDRISDTHNNLKWICESLIKLNLEVPVYLLESSFVKIENSDLDKLIPVEFKDKVIFTQMPFTDHEKFLIGTKGKGYSELLMLKKYLESDHRSSEFFLKISGRYQILNFSKLVNHFAKNNYSDIYIDYTFFWGKCSTIIFFARKSVFTEHFVTSINSLDDKAGIYIERLFLSILKSSKFSTTKFIERPVFPIYLKSGSHTRTYTFLKQFATDFIYRFP